MSGIKFSCNTLVHAALCSVLISSGIAGAQSYPSHPVRMIVPFPPGGGTDLLARVLAQNAEGAFTQRGAQTIGDGRRIVIFLQQAVAQIHACDKTGRTRKNNSQNFHVRCFARRFSKWVTALCG